MGKISISLNTNILTQDLSNTATSFDMKLRRLQAEYKSQFLKVVRKLVN